MPVASFFIAVIPGCTPQLIQVVFKGNWACVAYHWVPLGHNASILDTLEMGGGAVVIGVVDAEAPPTVLPQGAIPFGMVGFFIAALKAIGEGGMLTFPFALVLGYGA